MGAYNRKNSGSFAASLILIILIAAFAAAGYLLFGGESDTEEIYPWITSDPAAVDGMLDGSFYNGEKNSAGVLSYKIAEEITVGISDGKGDFKIESSGKNIYLMKVKIILDGQTVYETGYIKPNQHIYEDVLGVIPAVGTYEAEAVFEGFDPNTEEYIGAKKESIKIIVIS